MCAVCTAAGRGSGFERGRKSVQGAIKQGENGANSVHLWAKGTKQVMLKACTCSGFSTWNMSNSDSREFRLTVGRRWISLDAIYRIGGVQKSRSVVVYLLYPDATYNRKDKFRELLARGDKWFV